MDAPWLLHAAPPGISSSPGGRFHERTNGSTGARSWLSSSARSWWRRSPTSVGLPARKRRRLLARTGLLREPATPVPGAQTWHVLVNNVSPDGENWSFNAFYPDHLQAHPGDAIVFTLAPNPNAFHTVMVLNRDLTPLEMYEGFAGGFVRPLTRASRTGSKARTSAPGRPPAVRACRSRPVPVLADRRHRIRGQLRRPRQPAAGRRPGATPRSRSRWTRRCPSAPTTS